MSQRVNCSFKITTANSAHLGIAGLPFGVSMSGVLDLWNRTKILRCRTCAVIMCLNVYEFYLILLGFLLFSLVFDNIWINVLYKLFWIFGYFKILLIEHARRRSIICDHRRPLLKALRLDHTDIYIFLRSIQWRHHERDGVSTTGVSTACSVVC